MSCQKPKANPEAYTYPVYGTTIGGLARLLGSKYFFLEPPSNGEGKEGDEVPGCVELFPANELAAGMER
ncbi:hypothetical protein A2419_02175 [Candidatus Adlerbacteria bacterium RIFOXYC1_FULL_48_26]|uniref:Uncharacterized protein n=1 Tax=Candidatus Adlerbacteria bacterium RIFOXYC1_FULL_48_26 TaxID=1797247 RepID=A0A1F4Y3H8_9BACT|nr:MAG: hypothetical protein A2419_02175 [Candidatus Adlerbacteria bacterium RIFOXYC1_FULL_48_26]